MEDQTTNQERKLAWNELLHLLDSEYTTSIKDVCRMLKTSREWVNKYIKPHVRYLYVNTNHYGDNKCRKMNYLVLASKKLGRDLDGSVWMHSDEVEELLMRSIVSVTKQTKYIDVACLMSERSAKEYCTRYKALLDEIETARYNLALLKILHEKISKLHLQYLDDDAKKLIENPCSVTERTKIERIDVDYPPCVDPRKDWIAVHDIKKYGDTDESVYRLLFTKGAIRIELAVPDAAGVCGQKVFYIEDPDALKCSDFSFSCTVSETAWLEYKKKKGI